MAEPDRIQKSEENLNETYITTTKAKKRAKKNLHASAHENVYHQIRNTIDEKTKSAQSYKHY